MRVHELAKNAGLDSKQVLAIAKKHRIAVKQSASANVEDKDVRKLWPLIEKYKAEQKAKEEEEKRKKEEERRRKEEERRRKEEERRAAAEEKRRQEEEAKRQAEEEARKEKERQAEDERRRRAEERQNQTAMEAEQKRLRELGFDVRNPSVLRKPAAGGAAPGRTGPRPTLGPDGRPLVQRRPESQPRRSDDSRPPRAKEAAPAGPVDPSALNLDKISEGMVMQLPAKGKPAGRRREQKKDGAKPRPSKIFEIGEDMTGSDVKKPVRHDTGPMYHRRGGGGRSRHSYTPDTDNPPSGSAVLDLKPRKVEIVGEVSVGQFAEKLGIPVTQMMGHLLKAGELLKINDTMSRELMELLAPEFNADLTVIIETDEGDVEGLIQQDNEANLQRRPPVVTIMGHVDHGKTSLLDTIRNAKVAEGEYGGITQHIGAYHVTTSKGDIVFLDTPGHEAFTSMRARGASITDIVILVVAANDGFKPQTIEAIHHAQAANVPIVVAVNKIDLPGADPARVRQEALQHNLVPEDFGGQTIFVDISAKTGQNVDNLLELVALQAEIMDLKADAQRRAVGVIVESHIDKSRGAVATVLIQKGTLKSGDYFVAGDISGRVRSMLDDHGKSVREAGPAFPVEILGLDGAPPAGEVFICVENERIARDIAGKREQRRRMAGLAPITNQHITLENLHEHMEDDKVRDLNLVVKGDVQGSIEAVCQSLTKLPSDKIRIKILHSGAGGINESDVNLAIASDAVIIGFNVRPDTSADALAQREGVEIKVYRIIYDLIEDIRKAMTGMLAPKFAEKVTGHAEIRQTFKISRLGTIAGCYVTDGEIVRDSKVRLLRDSVVVYEGALNSLKRFKDDVKKVTSNMECGLSIENFNDLKEGDVVEAYTLEQVAVSIDEPAESRA